MNRKQGKTLSILILINRLYMFLDHPKCPISGLKPYSLTIVKLVSCCLILKKMQKKMCRGKYQLVT